MAQIQLCVIIVTYNSTAIIEKCLSAVVTQADNRTEVIVVDNGSYDRTTDIIEERFPDVTLIKNTANLGACRARNQGILASKAPWVLTLDCDVIIEKDFLQHFFSLCSTISSSVGSIQPKMYARAGGRIYSCGIALSKYLRRFYDIGSGKLDSGRFVTVRHVFGACCAAAFYRRHMLEEIKDAYGYFDERFFFLVEDVDLAWRAQNKGWKTLYCPEVVCYHSGNSSGFDIKLRQYLCFRNRYCSIIKNEGLMNYSMRLLPLLSYDIPRLLYLVFTNHYIFKKPETNYNLL